MSLLEESGSAMPDGGVSDGAESAPPVARLAPTHVVAAGVAGFADDLVAQGVAVTRVDWRPPPVGTEGDLADVALDRRRGAANALAVRRMLAAGAELVDVRPAREVLGLVPGQFLHAGPPIGWERASGPLRGALIGAALFEGLVKTPDEAEAWFAGTGTRTRTRTSDDAREGGGSGNRSSDSPAGGGGRDRDENHGGGISSSPAGGGGRDGLEGRSGGGRGGENGGGHGDSAAAGTTAPELAPCHHRGGVGPMAGVVSPSMWLFELRDPVSGGAAWCSLNEGLGKVLRYGAFGPEVVVRLRWMSSVLGPVLQRAVRRRGVVDVKAIVAQMLHMGDEGHNRNRAGTLMLLRELLPSMIENGEDARELAEVVRFVSGNDHFFLNLVMPACKLAAQAAAGVPGSTVVTVMARNGTDFGIQTSGTGDRWFTAPANTPEGLFLAGYGAEDANPDIGDSAITETAGVGGFAMAAAPAIARLVGGTAASAVATTRLMYEITLGENPAFTVPALDFRGTPTAIDVSRVVRTGVLPQINTGMAGRVAGTGQVGAGLVTPPMECFTQALGALAELARAEEKTDKKTEEKQAPAEEETVRAEREPARTDAELAPGW
ncbi:hypothetical protein ABH935_004055 [Catenulispora sp. GAS73]|uniref:DUF1116 domain-containing protein n=1 Tax=Catenulispora sp. GAS73 TaxID=3156269 RepID=UPI0035116BEC